MRTLLEIATLLRTLLSDPIIFPLLFQLLFFALFLYAVAKERGWLTRRGIALRVKRGEKSWGHFNLAYGIASVLLLQVINMADALQGYKTIISLVDLLILTYLAFFNSWSRNAIIGIISRSQEKWES